MLLSDGQRHEVIYEFFSSESDMYDIACSMGVKQELGICVQLQCCDLAKMWWDGFCDWQVAMEIHRVCGKVNGGGVVLSV